jgi:hypothetical protein
LLHPPWFQHLIRLRPLLVVSRFSFYGCFDANVDANPVGPEIRQRWRLMAVIGGGYCNCKVRPGENA